MIPVYNEIRRARRASISTNAIGLAWHEQARYWIKIAESLGKDKIIFIIENTEPIWDLSNAHTTRERETLRGVPPEEWEIGMIESE